MHALGSSMRENIINEVSPLTYHPNLKFGKKHSKSIDESDIDDFFPIIHEEMEKINSFFESKLAELRVSLDEIILKRDIIYRNHHTGDQHSDLAALRDIYIEIVHLRSYCDLNHTGNCFFND